MQTLIATLLVLVAVTPAISQDVPELRTMAEQGDADAQFKLGDMYYSNKGVPQDHREAAKWFRKAAEQGHAKAQFSLGGMYELGQGVPQDHHEAARWFRMAAEQGHAGAQHNLGSLYWMHEGRSRPGRGLYDF